MNPKSRSIAQVAASLAENARAEHEIEEEISRSRLVSFLLSMRVAKKQTQEEIAATMSCDPSKVSRIESGNDDRLRWSDILKYSSALNLSISLLFEDPSIPVASRIKERVFRIKEDLDYLTRIANECGSDDQVAKKIHEFSGEVLFNFLVRYNQHSEELQSIFRVSPTPISALADDAPDTMQDDPSPDSVAVG
jgi:transcriptional regulator with XRE-family HTH domain